MTTFDPLPRAYLTWSQSEVPIVDFLRYQVYRRRVGTADWTHLANITARDITSYDDYTIQSGMPVEYSVTQVMDVAGEAVESEMATPASVTVNCVDLFLHDKRAPSNYVQMRVIEQSPQVNQDIGFIQPGGRATPTPQVGSMLAQELSLAVLEAWEDTGYLWDEIRNLIERQHTHGATLLARQGRSVHMPCVIDTGTSRQDEPLMYTANVHLREVWSPEEVS